MLGSVFIVRWLERDKSPGKYYKGTHEESGLEMVWGRELEQEGNEDQEQEQHNKQICQ